MKKWKLASWSSCAGIMYSKAKHGFSSEVHNYGRCVRCGTKSTLRNSDAFCPVPASLDHLVDRWNGYNYRMMARRKTGGRIELMGKMVLLTGLVTQ